MTIDHARILEVLRYEEETGYFIWLKKTSPSSRCKVGCRAGSKDSDSGYRTLWVDGVSYYEHILVVLYKTGELPRYPEQEVDHINGVKDDNKWENLQVVSKRRNQQNRKEHREGKVNGCCHTRSKHPKTGKEYPVIEGKISINRDAISLGNFKTEEECNAVYQVACANEHLFTGNRQEFKKAVRGLAGVPCKETGYFKIAASGEYKVCVTRCGQKVLIGFFEREEDAIVAAIAVKKLKKSCGTMSPDEFRRTILEDLLTSNITPIREYKVRGGDKRSSKSD